MLKMISDHVFKLKLNMEFNLTVNVTTICFCVYLKCFRYKFLGFFFCFFRIVLNNNNYISDIEYMRCSKQNIIIINSPFIKTN